MLSSDGAVGEEAGVLDDVADAATQVGRRRRSACPGRRGDATAGLVDHPVDHPQRGGLAAAGGPDEDGDLAGGRRKAGRPRRRCRRGTTWSRRRSGSSDDPNRNPRGSDGPAPGGSTDRHPIETRNGTWVGSPAPAGTSSAAGTGSSAASAKAVRAATRPRRRVAGICSTIVGDHRAPAVGDGVDEAAAARGQRDDDRAAVAGVLVPGDEPAAAAGRRCAGRSRRRRPGARRGR